MTEKEIMPLKIDCRHCDTRGEREYLEKVSQGADVQIATEREKEN